MKKSKFRRAITVFLVILGVLAVLFSCLSPLIFQRDERLYASAEGAAGPVSVTLFWHNSLIKSATMVDSADNTVTFSNGVSQSPQLLDGQDYTVTFSYYSGASVAVSKVVCDNPYISARVSQPNSTSFTFTYNVGGLEVLFGIITKSTSYDNYQTITYSTAHVPYDVLYVQTEDSLMPRTLYPDKSYYLYISPLPAGESKSFTFTVFPSSGFIFLSASRSGHGVISEINIQDSTFLQTFYYSSSALYSTLTVSVLDISSWTDAAYDKGLSAGYQNGYNAGYDIGYEDGYNSGNDNSSQDYNKGYNTGYNEGYNLGLAAGQNISWGNLNVVSLFLSPVNSFLATPLFGSFSIGSAFSVVLVVLLASIFIKMFAGG